MRLSINVEIAHKYGMHGAIAWAALEKVISQHAWVQIKVSELCRLSGKIYSETPIKKAIKEFESDELIHRISDANADGARFRLAPNGVPYFRMSQAQRAQHQSPMSSFQPVRDVASEV